MKKKILIVEDEFIVALDLENSLEKLGFTVVERTASGEEACRLAFELMPDIILMDIMLADGIDGINAAERIKSRFDIPIIFLTGFADSATINRAQVVCPDGFLVKPFREKDLLIYCSKVVDAMSS